MTDDVEFWKQQRADRLTVNGREPFTVGYADSDSGGFCYVPNEIIADPDAIGALSAEDQALVVEAPDHLPWLGDGLRLFQHVGDPLDFLPFVARWRRTWWDRNPRGSVDFHYVLTGEKSTIPRGGPAGPPSLASPHQSPTDWGEGAPVVAILDTGLDPQSAAAQPMSNANGTMSPRVVFDPQADVDILGARPPVPGQVTELLSEAGHGTFIASLVARFAGGGVRIAALRVLDPEGIGSEQSVVEGLQRLRLDFVTRYDRTVKVVNLSLGGFTDDGGWLPPGTNRDELYPPELRDRVPSALAAELARWTGRLLQDVVMVAAAGNDGVTDRPFWPAALAASPQPGQAVVVSVASVDAGLQPSAFTNRGPWVKVSSLGEDVVGDYPAGEFRLGPQETETFDGRGARWSGTSFAAPLVTAQIANVAEHALNLVVGAAITPPERSGREAWGLLEGTLKNQPAPAGLGDIWDPRAVSPYLNPSEWP